MLLVPLTFLGFYKTYFIQFPDFEDNITGYIHVHAFIASLWILMLIVQPILILNKKNHLHKRLGKLSYIVFPLLILSFIPQMIKIINSGDPQNIFFPLADCISLVLFYTLAINYRRNQAKHMRFMIGTAIVFLGPTIGRIGPNILDLSYTLTQNLQYTIIYLILVGLIFWDRKNDKNPQPYLLILGSWIIHQITFNLIF